MLVNGYEVAGDEIPFLRDCTYFQRGDKCHLLKLKSLIAVLVVV